jgi:Domain of unknown function (DUF4276)
VGEKYLRGKAKMRTVYIVVEGQTEEEFVNNSLAHYCKAHGINNVVPILLETSPGYFGGDITFARYRNNIDNLLKSDRNAIITSLIDYYQLRADFPGYSHSFTIEDKVSRVGYIENQIQMVITDSRFVPYIQLHEFEGLLFSDVKGFNYIPNISIPKKAQIQYIVNNYPNPELINDGSTTAPSIRLRNLIPRYKKTFHGPIIALENGMTPLLAKCPRFRNWVGVFINKASTVG